MPSQYGTIIIVTDHVATRRTVWLPVVQSTTVINDPLHDPHINAKRDEKRFLFCNTNKKKLRVCENCYRGRHSGAW